MELTSILKLFTTLSGMTEEEALEQLLLMRLCAQEIKGSLKTGVSWESAREPLEYAAAALAFYRYTVISAQSGGITSVKIGETAFGADADMAIRAAASVRDEFMALAAPYLCRSDFYFQATF